MNDRPTPEMLEEMVTESTLDNARSAVQRAVRYTGMTCQSKGYRARRTKLKPSPDMKPGELWAVVELEKRTENGWVSVSLIRAVDIGDLRDDWRHPTPVDPGEQALPEGEYDLEELFVDPDGWYTQGGDI